MAKALAITPARDHEGLAAAAGERAGALFQSGRMLCAPAVLVALNRALGGGLDDALARRLTSGLAEGMAGAGCVCGALGGAQLALGLFLGEPKGFRRKALPPARELHDRFCELFGASCCRVLSRKVKHDPKAHLRQCADITARTAQEAARIILARRPALAEGAEGYSPAQRGGRLASGVRRLLGAG
jgi:C_GCAxxG_C_C family probable redox protein